MIMAGRPSRLKQQVEVDGEHKKLEAPSVSTSARDKQTRSCFQKQLFTSSGHRLQLEPGTEGTGVEGQP